jgi:hypothetical protein
MDWSGHFPNNQATVATVVAQPQCVERFRASPTQWGICSPRATGCCKPSSPSSARVEF